MTNYRRPGWVNDLQLQTYNDDDGQAKQRPIETQCPECNGKALIWRVRKKGRNHDRPILFCQDKEQCKLVKWMDLPHCRKCQQEYYEAKARGGKNRGRTYQACPNQCNGSFIWK